MTIKNALAIKKEIKKFSKKIKVESSEQVIFDIEELTVYKEIHNKLKNEGKTISDFNDANWYLLVDDYGSKMKFIFDLNNKYFNLSLKGYVLLKIKNGISVPEVQSNHNYIKEAIRFSDGLAEKSVEKLEEHIAAMGYRKKAKLSNALIEYMKFNNYDYTNEYYNMLGRFTNEVRKVRSLPSFNDILLFDDFLNRFFLTATLEERLKHYPVFLWWKITKILPLRPIEFYELDLNCVFQKKDGTYWITLPRKKRSPRNNEEIPITDTLQINEEIFSIIENYKKDANQFLEEPFLISHKLYYEFSGNKSLKSRKPRLDTAKFINVLKRFYKEVIEEKYGFYELERLDPGDTRHFAFCNMMLQGYNMLSIARIGGHRTLRQQMHYHSHLDNFAESAVTILTRKIRKNLIKDTGRMIDPEVEIRGKIHTEQDFEKIYPVEYGYCTFNPIECKVGDCRFCSHYLFKPSTENRIEAARWLRNGSKILIERIKEQIAYMCDITKNMHYNLQKIQYHIGQQEKLKTKGNELQRLIEQKSMLDALLMEELGDE